SETTASKDCLILADYFGTTRQSSAYLFKALGTSKIWPKRSSYRATILLTRIPSLRQSIHMSRAAMSPQYIVLYSKKSGFALSARNLNFVHDDLRLSFLLVSREGDEHELIGNKINDPSEPGIYTKLILPNGIQLTFGQMIALAGDFFALPNASIIAVHGGKKPYPGATPDERKRFMGAYATLASVPRKSIEKQVATLVTMIGEDLLVRRYHNGTLHTNAQYAYVTNGRMLKLAAINFDHFEPQAPRAYLVGHQLAMEKAREAAKEKDPDTKKKMLNESLSIDAFACHFLTDCFSSGHMRTPRVELHFQLFVSGLGDLLSKYMHDEDCRFGLRVKNKKGDKWNAYGDGYLIKTGDKDNFRLVVKAANTSAYQVIQAYQNPDREINVDDVLNLIPFVDPDAVNNTPLFQMKDGKLQVRVNLDDLQSKEISPNWTGAGRLAKLLVYQPKNSALPPA
ncbi:Hypothetical predicted protein, partial [Paramuricea clavata]